MMAESLLGSYTQTSGPSYALGAKICTLVLAASDSTIRVNRTWCDDSNATIAVEAWRVPAVAGDDWLGGQPTLSRLWAEQVFTGVEYDVSAFRKARTLSVGEASLHPASRLACGANRRSARGRVPVRCDACLPRCPSAQRGAQAGERGCRCKRA